MNNEDKIFALLEKMDERQSRTDALLETLVADVAELKQGQAEIKADVADIKFSLDEAWKDISIADDKIKAHEREFHSIGIK